MTVKLPDKHLKAYRRFKSEFLLARLFFIIIAFVALGAASLFHYTDSPWAMFATIFVVLLLIRALFWRININK